MLGLIISHCLLVILKEGKVLLISTLTRSGNNVSLIYLEYLLSYLLVPNFGKSIVLVSRYDTTIKEAFLKKFGAIYVVFVRGFCVVQLAVDKRRYNNIRFNII